MIQDHPDHGASKERGFICRISYHDIRHEIAAHVSGNPLKKAPTIENVNNMAAARSAAVVLLNELADDSAILETTSCDNDEFLFLLMISNKERKNRIRINSYFERIVQL